MIYLFILFLSQFTAADGCGFKNTCNPKKDSQILLHSSIISAHQECGSFNKNPKDQVAFEKCQTALFNKCYSKLNTFIDEIKLNDLYSNWIKSSKYRMKTPEVHCLQRAALLAKELSEKGYEAKIIEIKAPSLIGLANFSRDTTIYFEYSENLNPTSDDNGVHYAVLVNKNTVLDPQFEDTPQKLEDYAKHLSGQNLSEIKISEIHPILSPLVSKGSKFSDACGWHTANKDLKEISEINQWSFTTGKSIPENLKDKPIEEIKRALRIETFKNHKKNLEKQLTINQNLLNIIKSGKIPGLFGNEDQTIGDSNSLMDLSNKMQVELINSQEIIKEKLEKFDKLIKSQM